MIVREEHAEKENWQAESIKHGKSGQIKYAIQFNMLHIIIWWIKYYNIYMLNKSTQNGSNTTCLYYRKCYFIINILKVGLKDLKTSSKLTPLYKWTL